MDNLEQQIKTLTQRINQHEHQAADGTTPIWKTCFVTHTLFGTTPQTAGNHSIFFVAPFPCFVIGIAEVHSVANGGAATLQIEKLTGTQAPGAGTSLLTTAFNLNSTANTTQYAGVRGGTTLISQTGLLLGERLAFKESGALVNLANLVVTLQLKY